MNRLRTIPMAILIAAIAANQAGAAAMPCSCSPATKEKRSCCQRAGSADVNQSVDPASCCAKHLQSPQPAKKLGCCCYESVPATVSPRDLAGTSDTMHGLATCVVVPVTAVTPTTLLKWRTAPGLLTPSQPPLSVLYCVWLK